ncbi:MAG TPA: DedA family protein [Actinomycetota bacterium]|nr:DedA family protein [Actinomycetota bacterium]
MEQLLDALKEWIVAYVGDAGYWAVFILMALESACIPLPSEVTMPVAGLLAAEGKMSFFWAGMIGAFANLAGSWAAYAVGRSGGRTLLERYGKYVLIKQHDIERADKWFEKYGDAAVFFSRLLPVVRTFISLPAGVARMPLIKFSVLTFLGCLPWSFALLWAGYVLGEHWETILPYTEPIAYVIGGLILIVVVIWYVRKIRKARAAGSAQEEEASPTSSATD